MYIAGTRKMEQLQATHIHLKSQITYLTQIQIYQQFSICLDAG